jgi:hypothetical protein
MSATNFTFWLQKPHPRDWVAVFSDGVQETIITASDIPAEPLLPLLWAVRLLLLGASDSRCSWWEEPGEYRWLFSRQGEKLFIHISITGGILACRRFCRLFCVPRECRGQPG